MMTINDIGRAIRAERKRQGLRQDQLAAVSGVGLRFVTELERGKATAQVGKMLAVLAALGLQLELRRPDGETARITDTPGPGERDGD